MKRPSGDQAGPAWPPGGSSGRVSRARSPLSIETTHTADGGTAPNASGERSATGPDWNASRVESGDQAGCDPKGAIWRGVPPVAGTIQIPPRAIE